MNVHRGENTGGCLARYDKPPSGALTGLDRAHAAIGRPEAGGNPVQNNSTVQYSTVKCSKQCTARERP
eukprot:9503842-Pyramimonas_sp.AAC.2